MLKQAGFMLALAFAIALVAPATSPVGISYVTSDSMAPTIATGDGYVLVPADSVEAGDVVTFYSDERASYVTHRAVQVTEDGIVTKGDANPSTDQAAGYPPVASSDVTGRVLEVGGSPLLIPNLGTAVSFVQSYWYAIVAVLLGYLLVSTASDPRKRTREDVLRSRDVVIPALVIAVLVGVVLVSMAAVHDTQVYSVTDGESPGADTLVVGEERVESLTVRLTETPVTYVVTDTDGMEIVDAKPVVDESDGVAGGGVESWIPTWFVDAETQNVTVAISAQNATGPHETSLDMYPYPATLPETVIQTLHRIHPLVAAFGTVLVGLVPLYLLYWLSMDTAAPLRGTRRRLGSRLGGRR